MGSLALTVLASLLGLVFAIVLMLVVLDNLL